MWRGPEALARVSESAGGFRQMYLGAPIAMSSVAVRSRLRCMLCVYATHGYTGLREPIVSLHLASDMGA